MLLLGGRQSAIGPTGDVPTSNAGGTSIAATPSPCRLSVRVSSHPILRQAKPAEKRRLSQHHSLVSRADIDAQPLRHQILRRSRPSDAWMAIEVHISTSHQAPSTNAPIEGQPYDKKTAALIKAILLLNLASDAAHMHIKARLADAWNLRPSVGMAVFVDALLVCCRHARTPRTGGDSCCIRYSRWETSRPTSPSVASKDRACRSVL